MVFTRKNLDWWCARGILFFVLAMLVFAPLAFGAVDPWAFLVLQSCGAAIFILWSARLWLNPKTKILWPPLAWVVLIFAIYAVARYFTADIEYVARQELLQVLLFAFLFFAFVNNLRGQEETLTVSFVMIAVGTFCACYAVEQLARHSNQVWNLISPYAGRASGTYISPNNLSNLLAMLLPLALALLLVGKIGIIARILLAYATLAMAAGLAVTFSRAGWVAAAVGIFLLLGTLLFHRNHRLRAALLLIIILGGGTFFTTQYLSKTVGYMERVAKPAADNAPSVLDVNSRLEMWRAAIQMWRENFWWGVGPAHYDYRFREIRPVEIQLRPDRAHNDYLNLLADWGTVGGVIVAAGIIIFIFCLAKTWPYVRREENDFGSGQSNRFAFFLGASCGLTALAVHSAVDFNLHVPANALVGVTLLALLTSNLRFATEKFWRKGWPWQSALTILLLGTTVFFAANGRRAGREIFQLARASHLENFSTERADALKRAFVIEPKNFNTAYEIGECYRTQSLEGGENSDALAQSAMDWYAQATRLNVHDGYPFLRTGMCLDWLGRHADSEKFYRQAEARDPNSYYMVDNIGWHFVQIGDYAAAREYFLRSLTMNNNNDFAVNYLAICEQKMAEKAAGQPVFPDL
jgi:O-antigen ligase/Tfp pilus assembly protein PilF